MSAELAPCPFCGGIAKMGLTARVEWKDTVSVFCVHCSANVCRTGPVQSEATKRQVNEAWNLRTLPAMSADHIGDASPAVTEVGKLIQSPLVEKLVGALKRLATATERLMAAWPDTHVPGRKLCVEVSEALNDAKALAHIPDATNMVAPVEAVAWWEKVRAILDDTVDAETYGPFDDWARAVPESLDAAADAILDLIQSERAG